MKSALLLALVLLCSTAFAQPVITWENYPANLYPRIATFTAVDAEGTDMNVGPKGSTNNVYDVTSFTYDVPTIGEYLPPASTPYGASFPDATHVMHSVSPYGPAYTYSQYSESVLYNLGVGSSYSGTDFVLLFDPRVPSIKFPLMLGDAWDYYGNPIEILPGLTQTFTIRNEAYASGTLVSMAGTHECLVLKTSMVLDESYFDGSQTHRLLQRNISYSFLTNAGVMGGISIDTLDETSTSPLLVSVAYSIPSPADALEATAQASSFTLHPAYPNPVSAGTDAVLSWSNESRLAVRVSVFDALGREAAVLYEGNAPPGVHTHTLPTGTLRPGMYFVRVQSGATVRTTPFVVQR